NGASSGAVRRAIRGTRPEALAKELGVSAKALRVWLRTEFPRPASEHGQDWFLSDDVVAAARAHFAGGSRRERVAPAVTRGVAGRDGRRDRDESYVIDLCDEILDEHASRQHRFDWLRGDAGSSGTTVALPVDAYYARRCLV